MLLNKFSWITIHPNVCKSRIRTSNHSLHDVGLGCRLRDRPLTSPRTSETLLETVNINCNFKDCQDQVFAHVLKQGFIFPNYGNLLFSQRLYNIVFFWHSCQKNYLFSKSRERLNTNIYLVGPISVLYPLRKSFWGRPPWEITTNVEQS